MCVCMSVCAHLWFVCVLSVCLLYSCCGSMNVHVRRCLCICTRVCMCNPVCMPVSTPVCVQPCLYACVYTCLCVRPLAYSYVIPNPQTFTKHPIKSLHFRLKQTSLSLLVLISFFSFRRSLHLFITIQISQSLGSTTCSLLYSCPLSSLWFCTNNS